MEYRSEKRGLSLNISNLTKQYGNRVVLKNLNLFVRSGEFISIVGKSGCGKSTILRIIAQLEKITEGTVNSDHLSRQEMTHSTRMMFQDARLLPWKNLLENVGLGLKSKDWKDKAFETLKEVGLEDRAEDWPSTLSGGQKQRVALARALVHQPRLLLLDEPLGALDALTRMEMQQLIEKLWKRYEFTVLLVTHDINEAIVLSDRVVLIENGTITLNLNVEIGRPRNNLSDVAKMEQILLERILHRSKSYPEFII